MIQFFLFWKGLNWKKNIPCSLKIWAAAAPATFWKYLKLKKEIDVPEKVFIKKHKIMQMHFWPDVDVLCQFYC